MFDLPTFTLDQTPPAASALPPGPPVAQRGNFITAGLQSGFYNTLAAGAGALSGGAKLLGANDASASLGQHAAQFQSDAAQVGRPDIDEAGWTGGGLSGFVKKLGYTAAQAVPAIAGAVGGGIAATAAAPVELATLAGIGGAAATQIPLSFGEQVNAAAAQPGGLTRGNAGRALAQAVPVGIAQSIVPGEGAILAKGGAGILGQLGEKLGTGTLARFTEHGITNAAVGAVGAGLQTAADDSFDPSLSAGERAANIVHAATQGAIGGGLIGGAMGGLFGAHQIDQKLAEVGLDPKAPAETEPPRQLPAPGDTLRTMDGRIFDTRPRPAPETPVTDTQTELPLQATASGVAGVPDIQYNLFGTGPYYAGVKPSPELTVRGAAPAPEPAAGPTLKDVLKTPPAPPPNAFLREQLKAANIGLSGGRDFKKFLAGSTATNPAELYNELRAIPDTSPLADDKKFSFLRDRLQVDVLDLPEQLAAAQADPKTPPAEIIRLQHNIALRAQADALLAQREAAKAAPAPVEAPVAAPITAVAAPDDIPELADADQHTTPAVPTDTDAPRAAEAASDTIQTAGPSVVGTTVPQIEGAGANVGTNAPQSSGAGGSSVAPAAAPEGPKSIADKVLDVARSAAGPNGGEVDIAQLRAALPDIAPKDLENALREIHTDDSDHTLVQAPKGQRTGVDGISVPGQGRFHKLEVAPQEGADAVQVGGAAAQALGDQSQGGSGVREGDAAGSEVARAGETLGAEAGSPGAAEPAGQGTAQALVTGLFGGSLNKADVANYTIDAYKGDARELSGTTGEHGGFFSSDPEVANRFAKGYGESWGAEGAPQVYPARLKMQNPLVIDAQGKHAADFQFGAAKAQFMRGFTGSFDGVVLKNTKDEGTVYIPRSPEQAVSRFHPDIRAAATEAKIAPQDPNVRSPEQAVQTAAKTQATANILAAPPVAKAVSKPIVAKLRKQTRAKTALIETSQGDQIPTAAVGGDLTDLPQATATSVDPILPAGPAEPIAKTPFGRVAGIADNAPVVPRAQLDAHVAKFVAKLRPDVQDKIHVLDSADQHDPLLRDAAARAGLDLNSTSAIYHDGQVFIHANQMRNLGEVEDTLSHEVFGHMATAQRFEGASDYQTAMSKIFDRAGGAEGIERLARERGIWDENDDGKNLQGAQGLKSYLPPVDDDQVRARNLPGGVRTNTPTSTSLLTPLYKTRIMDELIAHSAGTTPSALDRGIQAIQDMARKGIVNVLRRAGMANFARQLDMFTQADLSKWVADSRKALAQQPKPGDIDLLAGTSDPRMFIHDVEPTGEPPFLARISGQQRDTQGVMGLVGSMLDHIRANIVYKDLFGETIKDPSKMSVRERALAGTKAVRNYFVQQLAPGSGIAKEGAVSGMPGLLDHNRIWEGPRANIETRINQLANPTFQQHRDLATIAPDHKTLLDNIGHEATLKGIDYDRPYAEQPWLWADKTPEEAASLKDDYERLAANFKKLGQPAKGNVKTNAQQILRDQRKLGKFAWHLGAAQTLHTDLVEINGVDPGYSPAHRYIGQEDDATPQEAETRFNDVDASAAFAQQSYQDMMAAAAQHLADRVGDLKPIDTTGMTPEAAKTVLAKQKEAIRKYKDLRDTVEQNKKAEELQVNQGPYFRVGRRGEFAVSGKVAGVLDDKGEMTDRADPAALKAIADHLNKNFPQVSFGLSDENRSFFARFESQSHADNFANLFRGDGPLRRHIDQEYGTKAALMSSSEHGLADAIPALEKHIDMAAAMYDRDLERMPDGPSKDALKDARNDYIGNLRASLISLRGDNSMSSILSRRMKVQGFSSDLLRNQQEAMATRARDIAFTATRFDMARGLAQARDAIKTAASDESPGAINTQARMQRIYDAYEDRNKAANMRVDNTFLSWTKRFMHPYQLAMSPGYFVMNGMQVPTLTLPELVKFHGYGRSTAALLQAMVPAGRLIASMVKQKGVFEGGITKAVLDGARLGKDRDFASTMTNYGHFELGSFTANQDGLSYGNMGRVQKFVHFVNSTALLAETFTRAVAAFAAKNLHENLPEGPARQSMLRQFPTPEDYAGHVVNETMMGWGNSNTPKFMTAGGPLGQASPAVFQFHGWTPRLFEKIYREAANGYTNRLGEGQDADAMRAEARSFTKAHLGMVTAVSGVLGLPFISTGLGLGTKATGLVADQPIDLEAGLRDFLANTFGKDMGEALARGVPRYMGTDMSELGDNNFLPFARLLEDRRKFEDAAPDYAAHAWGSSIGTATNAFLAARELSEGRFSEAGARSLPTSLRNLVRAYRVDQYGYTNSTGQRLPVEAGSAEVLKTALGMQGGQLSEERERQGVLSGLRDDRQYRMGLIKKDLALAMTRGDQAGVQAAVEAARKFDQDNPGQRFTASLRGFIDSRQKAVAYGNQLGTLGLRPADRMGRELTNF